MHLKIFTHMAYYDCDWNRKRSPHHLFHLTIPAFKAWHAMDLKLKKNFNSFSALPLFHNKFISNDDDKPINKTRYADRILSDLDNVGKELLIGDVYEEVIPSPSRMFNYEDVSSHRMKKLSSSQIKLKFNSDINETHWNGILQKISKSVDEVMVQGAKPDYGTGWYAREVVTLDDPIGDIYYKYNNEDDELSLHYFEFKPEELYLQLVSSSKDNTPDWTNWEINSLPHLRPLKVSCITGLLVLIGWANTTISMEDFLVPSPNNKERTVE